MTYKPTRIHHKSSLLVEGLEQRLLMRSEEQLPPPIHGVTCGCCRPQPLTLAIQKLQKEQIARSRLQAPLPLSSVPVLSSRPGAGASMYLDFDGAAAMTWGQFSTTPTPAYSIDGDTGTFSAAELNNMAEIHARVSEAYSPFDINVTTVDPGNLTDKVTVSIVIGGAGSWYGSAGGVAYVGAFYNTAPNIGWVFPGQLGNGYAKYVADAASHEAGHTFGLSHQSRYSGSTKTAEYNPGTSAKAPIMGNSYSATRATWWSGPTPSGASAIQTDVGILSNANNGYGYRDDDHGGTTGTATTADVTDDTATASGVIELVTDKDYFSFSTLQGPVSFTVSPVQYGNLDATLQLVSSTGTVLATSNTTALSETVSANLSAGQYYVIVSSKAVAGDIGQYTLSGTIVTDPNFVAAPASFTATTSAGQVTLRWTDMSWNETGFKIERSDDSGSTWDDVTTTDDNLNTYLDTTVAPGNSYQYRLKALGESDESSYTGAVTVNVTPASPGGLGGSVQSASQINVSWNDVAGETGYKLERSLNNATWTQIATPAANATSYSDTSLAGGTKYYYRITALSGVGNSSASASINATTRPIAPASFTGAVTASSVTLSWTNVVGETGYRVEASADGSIWSTLATKAVNVVSHAHTSLTADNDYYYRVYAINAGGDSVASSTLARRTLLAAPAGLAASATSTTQIELSWTDSTGETGYRLERLAGTAWAQVGSDIDPDETSLSITSLSPGTAYCYRIRALNAGGASLPGATASATTIPPAPTTLTAAVLSTSSIRLTWTNVAGETGYKIERSPDGSDWTQIATTAANIATYTNTLLSADTQYTYRLRPYNAAGNAAYSSSASGRTLLNATAGLAASVASTTQINLSWTDSTGETGYRVERLSGTTWVQVGGNLDADTDSLNITGLTAGTAYSYRIRAINAGGLSLPSATVSATTIPPAPATLTAAALSTSQIKLTWTNVAGETGYKIERSPDGSDWTQIATTAVNVATYTSASLSTDTVYSYRVRPYNAAGDATYSGVASTRTLMDAPTGLTATAVSTSQINLEWTDSNGEMSYRVERLSGTTWVQMGAVLAADTDSLSFTGLAAGTAYSYRVRSVNAGGTSLGSATATATTVPTTPTSLSATVLSSTSIQLTWTNVSGESGYKLERSPDGSDWTQIATPTANVNTYSDTSLSADTAYAYRVRATNAAGDGAFSANRSTRTLLNAPTGLAATVFSTSRIDLEWNDSTGETGYRIERLSGTSWVKVGADLAGDVTTASVTGLAAGTFYSFRVRAINAGGASVPSDTSTGTTIPAPPAALSTTLVSAGSVKLAWSNVAGETGYRIERSTNGTDWSEITTVSANVITYTNTGLSTGTYYYRVKPYNAAGTSAPGPTATRSVA